MLAKRILVVDDEPNVVKSCARILELEGFEVRGTTDGSEAIALYKEENFDLTLTDLKMPDVDGLQVLAAIREYDPSASVVTITAYGTKENVVEALRLGASEFLEKPLNAKSLIATVHRILAQRNGTTVRGNLRTLSLPNIVQINCEERHKARLQLKRQGQQGSIYFAEGDVVHAELGSWVGEDAVYELLNWEQGSFELEQGVSAPERTINVGWSSLLLEGMRRIDERKADRLHCPKCGAFLDKQEQCHNPGCSRFVGAETGWESEGEEYVELDELTEHIRRDNNMSRTTTDVLKDVMDVPGISTTVVIGRDGFVIEAGGDTEAVSLDALGASLAHAVNAIETMGQELEVLNFQDLFVEYGGAMIVGRPVGDAIVAFVASDASQLGIIRYKIKPLVQELASFF
jgi:DNA-binding response OmpR family regulator/predicted regulator of Ras-like GTPase activity (Roadblock/LC7/MglB family)